MTKRFIGIDPGSKGCVAIIQGDEVTFMDLDKELFTYEDIIYALNRQRSRDTFVCVEDVHGMPGQSCSANTTFMKLAGYAELTGWILSTAGFMKVAPSVWKRHFNLISKGLSKTERKHRSIELAKRLYPSVANYLTASKDGRAEALLIARYHQDVLSEQELQ